MIPVDRLLYKLDAKLNKLASTEHQYIPLVNKLFALNEAQLILIKKKLNGNNLYNAGMDAFKKRYNDLQTLVVQFEQVSANKTEEIYSSYKVDLNSLSKEYYLPLEIIAECTKEKCTKRPLYVSHIVKHGDLQVYLNNNNYKPSFEYQETLGVISDDQLYLYTDSTFSIDTAHISYLRYPIKIDKEGYTNFDGVASSNVDCELNDDLENELLDLAVLELAMNTENTPQVQMSEIRNKINE